MRIIGGKWRRRRLPVVPIDGLRPSKDRVRETLFNWLAPVIEDSRCLDLFAGTGALGFEAASRGAAQVVLVDYDQRVVSTLRQAAQQLAAEEIEVVHADGLDWLAGEASAFDIVFLDPPFGDGLLHQCCQRLLENRWVHRGSFIYVETEGRAALPRWPIGWGIFRQGRAGNVAYYLIGQTGNGSRSRITPTPLENSFS